MEHLNPSTMCQSDSPEIKALAKKIAGNKKGRAAAVALFNWVQTKVRYRIAPMAGAVGILHRKPMKGMCYDKTNLLVALCRAHGIPARYLLMTCELTVRGKKSAHADFRAAAKKAMHSAAELQIGGKWVTADPAFDRPVAKLLVVPRFGQKTWGKVYKAQHTDSLGILPLMLNMFVLLDAKVLKKYIGT